MADNNYKTLGVLAVCLLVIGLVYIVIKWPKSKHATFSQHVAVRKQSIIYYAVLFAIVLSLLTLFFLQWFVPAFHLSMWFSACILVSSLAQFACTLIPETGGRQSSYHRLLAGVSALLLIPASALLLFSESIDMVDKVFVAFGLTGMVSIVCIVLLYKGQPRYFLLLQTAYFAAFFVPLLITAYL